MSESFLQAFRSLPRELSLSDKVTEQITEAIVSRQVQPGERLPSERELGARFNVSRTVIREAVRSLAARGLVRVTSASADPRGLARTEAFNPVAPRRTEPLEAANQAGGCQFSSPKIARTARRNRSPKAVIQHSYA